MTWSVCDKLPSNMTYVSLGSATLVNGKACWDVGDLTGSKTLSMIAKVDVDASAGIAHEQRHGDLEQRGQRQGPRDASTCRSAKHGVKGKLEARRRCHRLASSTSART